MPTFNSATSSYVFILILLSVIVLGVVPRLPEESKVLFTPRASQKSICQTKYKTFKYIFQYKLRLGHMYLTIPYLSLEAFVL